LQGGSSGNFEMDGVVFEVSFREVHRFLLLKLDEPLDMPGSVVTGLGLITVICDVFGTSI